MQQHRRHGYSWREAGAGDPLLFLHPVVSTSAFWHPQFTHFADSRRCIALDAPGFDGTNDGATASADLGAWLVSFLDVIEVEQVDAVGLSLGGGYAMYGAARAPQRFRRLVLADTSARFGIDPTEWLANWLAPLDTGATPATLIDDIFDAIVHTPPSPQHRRAATADNPRISAAGFRAASAAIAHHDATALLPAISVPTLVVVGEHDGETPPSYSRGLCELLPNATLDVIADAGHLSSLEQPAAFNAAVERFLDA